MNKLIYYHFPCIDDSSTILSNHIQIIKLFRTNEIILLLLTK